MLADVPGHITQPSFVQNSVKVQAGTNWDFSRGAVATPIVALPDPQPRMPDVVKGAPLSLTAYLAQDNMPDKEPLLLATFSDNHVVVSMDARTAIKNLDKFGKYVVAGHADSHERNPELLARQRANAIAAQMKRQGFKNVVIKSFGDRRQLSRDKSINGANLRVEVFAQ